MRFLRRFLGISRPRVLRSTFDVTGVINSFMNKICFSGYVRNAENQIVRANYKVRFCTVCFIYMTLITVCIAYRLILYSKTSWDFLKCISFINECVTRTFVIISMLAAYKCDIACIQTYYQNHDHIDKIVGVSGTSFYTLEKNKYNKLFFMGVIGHATKLTFDIVEQAINMKWVVLGYVEYIVSTFAIVINMLSITVKLAILKDRFKMFGNRLSAALETPWKENPDEYVDIILQLKHGYQLFYKQQVVLSKIHGWQILFGVINMQLFLIVSIYYSVSAKQAIFSQWTFLITASTRVFFTGGILCAMTYCFEEMLSVRKRMISQLEEAILILEINLVNHSEDKEIHRQVKTLLKQIRRQPLSFSLCKIFQLDYSLIQSVLSFTVTYTIVLAQFNKEG